MGPLGKIVFTTNQLKLRAQELTAVKHKIDKISSIFIQRTRSISNQPEKQSQPEPPKGSQNQPHRADRDSNSTWSHEKKCWTEKKNTRQWIRYDDELEALYQKFKLHKIIPENAEKPEFEVKRDFDTGKYNFSLTTSGKEAQQKLKDEGMGGESGLSHLSRIVGEVNLDQGTPGYRLRLRDMPVVDKESRMEGLLREKEKFYRKNILGELEEAKQMMRTVNPEILRFKKKVEWIAKSKRIDNLRHSYAKPGADVVRRSMLRRI